MTKDEREQLREIQETLIGALAKVTEILGTSKTKPKPITSVSEYDSESKERWIAR